LSIVALCRALEMAERAPEIDALFSELLGPNGDVSSTTPPAWQSDVCDDHTPFEFSVSMTPDAVGLRILAETVAEDATLEAIESANKDTTTRLASRLGLSLERLQRVEDLFASGERGGLFSRWHALEFHENRPVETKIYLNPLLNGPEACAEILEESVTRLGFAHAWQTVRKVAQRGAADELKYFSLDLSSQPEARVKIYLRHHDITFEELERSLAICRGVARGQITEFCSLMSDRQEPLSARPIFSCLAWASGDSRPTGTIYLPIAAYAPNDAVARNRIRDYLQRRGIPTRKFDTVMRDFANRPLEEGVGMLSYVSTKLGAGPPRVTAYLSPEVYSVRPPRESFVPAKATAL
jgi:DMATS type aromatic prenyltransferase